MFKSIALKLKRKSSGDLIFSYKKEKLKNLEKGKESYLGLLVKEQ